MYTTNNVTFRVKTSLEKIIQDTAEVEASKRDTQTVAKEIVEAFNLHFEGVYFAEADKNKPGNVFVVANN